MGDSDCRMLPSPVSWASKCLLLSLGLWYTNDSVVSQKSRHEWVRHWELSTKDSLWFPMWLLLVPVLHFPHNVLLSSGCCSCVVWFVIPSPQLMYLGQCRHNLLLELSTILREVFIVPGERWLATWWKHILVVLRIYTEQACECKYCN